MKEYPIGIHTNAWNAIRYVVITLTLVPFAEKVWALFHGKRTGRRIVRGRTARLRRSNLAHWGLHQEVDENSRLSKISAIAVCVLHIAGALLLEYGSGSTETFILQDSMVSQTLREDVDLRANGTYIVDTSYIHSQMHGSADCIDGGSRKLSDFGLHVIEKAAFTFVSPDQIPRPNISTDLIRWYFVGNSGWRFAVYGNGSSRWYAVDQQPTARGATLGYLGYTNEKVSCSWINGIDWSCSKFDDVGHANLLSASLAIAAVPGISWTRDFWPAHSRELRLNLSRVFAFAMGERGPFEAKQETTWLRDGMPPKRMPQSAHDLDLNITGLHNGCKHRHAVFVSDDDKISGLKVSNVNFSRERQAWFPDQEDHKLVLHAYENYVAVGTLMQVRNGYCCSASGFRMCITSLPSAKHELSFHTFDRYETKSTSRAALYYKRFSCSVEGVLRKTDVLNIAVQSLVEARRPHPVSSGTLRFSAVLERIAKLIEGGRVYSGLIRGLETQVKGKAVSSSSDIATINILGIVGFAVLTLLVAVPVPILFYYRKGTKVDVESSFRRAVMEINCVDSSNEVSDILPIVSARDDSDGQLKYIFTM